jgi:hypothetical protein
MERTAVRWGRKQLSQLGIVYRDSVHVDKGKLQRDRRKIRVG